tara:strand:- start:109 stop:993 length:885 start_codon:yes stop_codon:yes gene_type:complete
VLEKIKVNLRFLIIILYGIFYKKKNYKQLFVYHHFNRQKNITNSLNVDPENFKKQILYFKKNIKNFIITIDDADHTVKKVIKFLIYYKIETYISVPLGFVEDKNSYEYLLSKYLHSKFFNCEKLNDEKFRNILKITSRELKKKLLKIDKKKNDNVSFREKISKKDLINLSKFKNIKLVAHGTTHVYLSQINKDWLKWELKKSRQLIKKIGGEKFFFVLPYGKKNSFNNNVIMQLKKNKFTKILTNINGHGSKNNLFYRNLILNSSNHFYLRGVNSGGNEFFDDIMLSNKKINKK